MEILFVMNMQILKPSRNRLHSGDLFTYKLKGRDFGFGRVIRTDCLFAGSRKIILIYIYDAFASAKHRIPSLSKDRLLLAPLLIDRLTWSLGYFETVENQPLGPDDILRVHCFWTDDYLPRRRYLDENGHWLRRRSNPCNAYGLDSFRTVDVAISKALGIAPSPDTLPPPPPPTRIQEQQRQRYKGTLTDLRREQRKRHI